MEFRTNYEKRVRKPFSCSKPGSVTVKQSFKAECDINNIMRKYQAQGVLPSLILQDPKYGDFSNVPDYQEALNLVLKAQAQFGGLSAEVRDRFGSDPSRFLAFCENPANQEELISMGLATRKPATPVANANAPAPGPVPNAEVK